MIEYYINENKRTVVAVLTVEETGDKFVGKAKCDPNDTFNEKVGKTVARLRALCKFKQADATDAVAQFQRAQSIMINAHNYAKLKTAKLISTEKILNEYLKKL